MLGPGGWGEAAPAPCCKPAASSAVPNARVLLLLLLLPSAAAALLLHPIIVRGGCEQKPKPNQKANTPKQTTQAHPPTPPLSHTHPPLSLIGGTPRTGCASLALGRGGRAGERRGEEGAGARHTGKIAFVSGTASGAGARCCGCRSPPLSARSAPAAPRRHRAGERAARRLLSSYYYCHFFSPSRSLSLSLHLPFRRCDFCLFGVQRIPPPARTLLPARDFSGSSRNPRSSRGFSHPSWGL